MVTVNAILKKIIVIFIVLMIKQYIYRQRCLKKELFSVSCTSLVQDLHDIEFYAAKHMNKLKTHYLKWSPIYPKLYVDIVKQNNELKEFIKNYVTNT